MGASFMPVHFRKAFYHNAAAMISYAYVIKFLCKAASREEL